MLYLLLSFTFCLYFLFHLSYQVPTLLLLRFYFALNEYAVKWMDWMMSCIMEIEKAVCAQSCDQIFDQEEAKGMFSDTKGLSLAQLILLNVEIDALCFWPTSCAPLTYIYIYG